MESELVSAVNDAAEQASRQMAEDLREEIISQLEGSYQGAPELVNFISDVQDDTDGFSIEIRHPTAPLHERGGYIEPSYTKAQALGWTRDGFYEALTDCNEVVERKRYTFNAVNEIDRQWGER